MRLFRMFSLLFLGAMVWACDAVDSIQPLSVNPSEFDVVDAKGATLSFAVSAPSSWRIECSADWIVTDPGSGHGSKGSEPVFLIVSENDTPRKRVGLLTITCGGQKKTIAVTQSGAESQEKPEPEPEPLPEVQPSAFGTKWMELPATNTSGLDCFYHDFPLNGKTYRNYSFGWDDGNKVAIWVAYPLCKFYTDSYNGLNNRHEEYFVRDPLLGSASPLPAGGYAGSYDRGHQIPSADRQCSELANGQTYYGTNMTAQSNPLNGGPWADLEGYVRNFAKSSSSDTTYVVTGCYVKDSSEWQTDSDGMKIKVPTAYYKAVLVLKNNTWTGGAYWTPHVGYSCSYLGWAISIDELEEKIGIDLYVYLPEKIGVSDAAAIEAAKPGGAKWWRK